MRTLRWDFRIGIGRFEFLCQVRVGIATVLSRIFSSRAVDASVGPSVLETINALLTHLRTSVEKVGLLLR